ncbi:MAG: FKBP-type peptidyl-prolyl cis-trans isomerase [Bacteroidetes bacterium]|nr:FKBP-type peptidyl-prolyl cis-trans isomerase [Bacteroidota bacterium]
MKNSLFVFLSLLIISVSCSNQRETASGQKFTVIKKGDGKEVDKNKILVLSFLMKDSKDSVWNDSKKTGYPWLVQKKAIAKEQGKLFEVITMLTQGDSATFSMSAVDFFVNSFHQIIPPKVDSASLFTFYFSLNNALDSGEQVQKFQEALVAKQNEKMQKQLQEQLGKDTIAIDDYLKEKNIVALKTKSGLRYVVTKPGAGAMAKAGQTVKVDYAGHVLNGKYFDTSIESVAKKENLHQEGRTYSPYEFVLGRGGVIRGWDEVLQLMNKGEKITVYIPSPLGYGSMRRSDVIVENSILVFDMELMNVK